MQKKKALSPLDDVTFDLHVDPKYSRSTPQCPEYSRSTPQCPKYSRSTPQCPKYSRSAPEPGDCTRSERWNLFICIYLYICFYIYIYVCVCVYKKDVAANPRGLMRGGPVLFRARRGGFSLRLVSIYSPSVAIYSPTVGIYSPTVGIYRTAEWIRQLSDEKDKAVRRRPSALF